MSARATAFLGCAFAAAPTTSAAAAPETVYFKSADGVTEIVGYLFRLREADLTRPS
jgi:hypothetical protein